MRKNVISSSKFEGNALYFVAAESLIDTFIWLAETREKEDIVPLYAYI